MLGPRIEFRTGKGGKPNLVAKWRSEAYSHLLLHWEEQKQRFRHFLFSVLKNISVEKNVGLKKKWLLEHCNAECVAWSKPSWQKDFWPAIHLGPCRCCTKLSWVTEPSSAQMVPCQQPCKRSWNAGGIKHHAIIMIYWRPLLGHEVLDNHPPWQSWCKFCRLIGGDTRHSIFCANLSGWDIDEFVIWLDRRGRNDGCHGGNSLE